jgi:hypothetical protein
MRLRLADDVDISFDHLPGCLLFDFAPVMSIAEYCDSHQNGGFGSAHFMHCATHPPNFRVADTA